MSSNNVLTSEKTEKIDGIYPPRLFFGLAMCFTICWLGAFFIPGTFPIAILKGLSGAFGIGFTIAILGFSIIYLYEERPKIILQVNKFREYIAKLPDDLPVSGDFSVGRVTLYRGCPAGSIGGSSLYPTVSTQSIGPYYGQGLISGTIKFKSGREYALHQSDDPDGQTTSDAIAFNKMQKYCLKLNPHFKKKLCIFNSISNQLDFK